MTAQEYRDKAFEIYEETDVAVDPDSEITKVDGGAWVEARVWVGDK